MTLDEWIQRYVDKTGEYPKIPPGFKVVFQPEHGFFYWAVEGDVFYIDHVCTADRLWWKKQATDAARALGCKIFRTFTHRNPKAYAKLMGATENKALSGVKANGKYYYCFEMGVN
jgi:hypothetical protein